MRNFDVALKELFQTEGTSLFNRLGGSPARDWLNVEFARTRAPRADLVAWLENGTLFHLEFQSNNDPAMPWRMLEYYALLYQQYGVEPVQAVLYLGSAPLKMAASLEHKRLLFRYQVLDVRQMDGEELLSSPHPGDNVLAVLCRTPETKARLHRIVERLALLDSERQKCAARLFLLLSFLRGLGGEAEEELSAMPIVIDPMEDSYLRGLLAKGHKEGLMEGLEEGRNLGRNLGRNEGLIEGRNEGLIEGRNEGKAAMLAEQILDRFGALPEWAERRLQSAQNPELMRWGKRLLRATRIEDVFD